MRIGEFKDEMSAAGCRFDHEGGDHEIWYSPITDQNFPVPRHDSQEMGKYLESRLRKLSGVKKKR